MNRLLKTTLAALAIAFITGAFIAACGDGDDQNDSELTNANSENNTNANGENDSNVNASDENDSNDDTQICTPGATRCDGADNVEVCDDDGDRWESTPCEQDERCDTDIGDCTDQVCDAGEFEGCTDDGLHRHCNATGTDFVDDECPNGDTCSDGACPDPECGPGATRCGLQGTIDTCSEAGVWTPSQVCPFGTDCFDGECEELCEISSKSATYIGCEYWSIDLDNYQEALAEPHAIIVTNYNEDLAAEVKLFEGYSDRRILYAADGEPFDEIIPPGQAKIFEVAPGYGHSGTAKFQDQAIRVTSTIPVVAHQFNPLNHVDVFSNDGSLLLPTDSLGTEYRVLGWYNRSDVVQLRGYVTMVNASSQPNEVTVTPSAQVVAGSEIPTIEPEEERTFVLEAGESLNLVSSGAEMDDAQVEGCLSDPDGNPDSVDPCPDLTGTHVEANQPIALFGGHQCANVLLGVDRCDHIESQLPPVDTWGTEYVGTKFEPRAVSPTPEPDIWRVIAAEDDTRILTDPVIDGVHETRLDAGEWVQFAAYDDFEMAADAPILLAQYMVGANWPGIPRVCDEGLDAYNPTGIGDPAMANAVPSDQFRTEYIVHTPENYDEDYLNVIVPVGEDVEVNGETIPAGNWEVVGEMNRYEVATVEVGPGFHTLTGDEPFGVVGYGYACHVSYAYPGGTDLEPLDDSVPMP